EPAPASPAGMPEPTSSDTPETDPGEWFGRQQQMQRRRVAEEAVAGADPPPWRLPPDAVDRWSQTFEPAPYSWPAGAGPSPGMPSPGQRGPGSVPAAAPQPPAVSATVPGQAPPRGFVLFVIKVWRAVRLAVRGFVQFVSKVWRALRRTAGSFVQFVLLKMRP